MRLKLELTLKLAKIKGSLGRKKISRAGLGGIDNIQMPTALASVAPDEVLNLMMRDRQ